MGSGVGSQPGDQEHKTEEGAAGMEGERKLDGVLAVRRVVWSIGENLKRW
jgi:hypothetical protein